MLEGKRDRNVSHNVRAVWTLEEKHLLASERIILPRDTGRPNQELVFRSR